MRLLITENLRCAVTDDGSVWSPRPALGYSFWREYVGVFDEVYGLVRARRVVAPPAGWSAMNGPGVRIISVPYFVGPWQLATRYFAVKAVIGTALRDCDAVSLRLPSTMGQLVWSALTRGRPYGVYVTGDPHEALAPGMLADPSRPFFRHLFSRRLLRQTSGACAVAYVTSESLQRRYPAPPNAVSTHFTDAVLPDAAWVSAPRARRRMPGPLKVIMVGSFAHLIKAPDVLIEAVAICRRMGTDLRVVMVGDGCYRAPVENRCGALGLSDFVRFTGHLHSEVQIREQLDQADVFVLPSRTEGLPRAMLEAMARGLPCIGTSVGGIPELLAPEDLVPPGDAEALARGLQEISANQDRLAIMSARNLERCQAYHSEIVSQRRAAYLLALRQRTVEWQKGL